MFGYVRPLSTELRVREQEYYRAVYCGLCRVMRRRVSFFASGSLQYDFVFVCLLRASVTGASFSFVTKRCFLHPLRKRLVAVCEEVFFPVALLHLAMTYEKVRDDLHDKDTLFFKKLACMMYFPFLSAAIHRRKRKTKEFASILSPVSAACAQLNALEQQNSDDLDELALCSGNALALSASAGLSGNAKRLMQSTCASVGKLVYLLDACDDMEKDAARASFNPLLQRYGSLENAREHLSEIDMALALYAKELSDDTALFGGTREARSICENITTLGIPAAIRRVIQTNNPANTEATKEREQHS